MVTFVAADKSHPPEAKKEGVPCLRTWGTSGVRRSCGADRVVRPYAGTSYPKGICSAALHCGTPSPTRLVIARSEATRQSVFLFRADSHASVRRGTWAPPYRAQWSCGADRVARRDGISAGTRAVEHQGTHRGRGQRRATAHRGKLWRHNPLNRKKPENRLRVGQVSAKSQPTRVRKS